MTDSTACPRFHKCSATKCPLDPDTRWRVHLPGDPVCHYLLNAMKSEKTNTLPGSLAQMVVDYLGDVFSPAGWNEKGLYDLRSKLLRAALQPAKHPPTVDGRDG